MTPGFIDSHSHPVFVGDRSNEFQMRLKGISYNEITDIFFFQSGRWDIKTKNNQTIKLPKENLKKAFIKATKIIKNNNLNHILIDLRIPNQVILMNG